MQLCMSFTGWMHSALKILKLWNITGFCKIISKPQIKSIGFFCDFLFQNTKYEIRVSGTQDLKLMATSKFGFFSNFRAFFSER